MLAGTTRISTLLAVICLGSLFAQERDKPVTAVPRLVRFTSTFHAANGLAVGSAESATFSIYREEVGGTPLWQETQNVALDSEGHYTAMLGATQNEGVPLDLFSSTEPRWLGVQFNRSGETEQPRVQLVSVPYALKASDAETLGGKPASAYMLSSLANTSESPVESTANVGTSAAAPGSKAAKPRGISGTPTPNSIVKFTDSSGDIGNSIVTDNGTSIAVAGQAAMGSGQATQTFGYDLYVNGNNPIALIDAYANPGTASLLLQGRGSSASNQRLSVNSSGLFAVTPSNTGTAAMSITQSGNLGIGTAAPGAKLDVIGQAAIGSGGSTQNYGYDLYVNGSNPTAFIDAYANPGTASLILQGRGASPSNQTLSVNNNGIFSVVPSSTGTAAMSITQSGNLGIGTAAPGAKLDVIGQAAIGSGGNTQTFGYDLYVNANNPSMLLDAYANPGTASLTLQGRGASASNQTLSVNSSGLLSIAPSGTGTAALSITQSGNVGIGTTPTSKLNVSTGNTAFTVDSVIGVVTTTTSVNALTGEATTANGVIGQTTDPSSIANGVWGTANGTGSVGVRAQNNSTGVASLSVANGGTAAQLSSLTNSGTLLLGNSGSVNCPTSGSGCTTVFSIDASGNATFHNVTVNGTLTKPMGSFRIDHPLDPENKYLYHSFVESPDMKNIYDGVAILDEHGEATISLPDWFEALNQDFRYQLTCIGGYAPVYVASEVSGNQFRVAGGRPGLKVSWQLTGIRHDAYANAHRIQVEVDKPAAERDHLTSSLSSVPAGNGQ